MELTVKEINEKYDVWYFGKKEYGIKANINLYLTRENDQIQIDHIDSNNNIWLLTYGLDSYMLEPKGDQK